MYIILELKYRTQTCMSVKPNFKFDKTNKHD